MYNPIHLTAYVDKALSMSKTAISPKVTISFEGAT